VARPYDPNAIRERLEAERARVVGNLAGYRKQVARMDRPPTLLLTEAIERERRRLDQIDLELGVNVTRWPDHAGRGAAGGPKLSHI
jgi:hypothetical protein